MTSIWQKKTSRLKCNPGNFNVILGAVHEPGHWILTAMFPKLLKSLVLDSLGHASSKLKTCLESTRAFMRKHGCQVSRWKAETMPHSLQPDGSSCGIFVLKYAEKILAEEPLIFSTTRSAVCKYRKKVAVKLLKQTDDLRELCHYCGEKISKVDSDDPQNEKHTDWYQ
ncbi:sentrin-specific protease 2-like isoform X2 [Paramormyrops kingsleyae]